MPEFDNGPARVHYEIVGEGPPLLLIAGTASDGASWGPLVPLLAARQLILIDNRGSGQTKVEGPLSHLDMVDDCRALLDRLGIAEVDVVGHSLGGYLGLLLAARESARVKRLVTLGAAGMDAKTRVLFDDMARLYFTMVPQDWFRLLYQWLFSAPFFADEGVVAAAAEASTSYRYRQSPGDFARQVAASHRDSGVELSAIRCPVLAVAGELDLLAPPEAVRAMHADVPGVRHQVTAGAAHSIHWERPAETAAAIVGFLG